jgi:hypothetical protein
MDMLARLLNRERLLLELLVFKLVELRQLLTIGEVRFLGWAAEETERAVEAVRDIELERAVLVTSIAADHGIAEDDASLAALIVVAPEPYRTLLSDDRAALTSLSNEVGELLATTRTLASAGSEAVSELLGRVAAPGGEQEPVLTTYGPGATYQTSAPAPRVSRTL